MSSIYSGLEKQARKTASSAKSGTLKHSGNNYWLEFNFVGWNYKVYENDQFYITINFKNLTKAKKFLVHYLNN